jgi:perosamine synthetase
MSNVFTLLNLLCRPAMAGGTDLLDSYQKAFAKTIVGDSSRPALAFWRGRVALWTILRAGGVVSQDDEVILPAYTCEMVPTAVRFAGGRCVFVDVEHGCFNPSVQQIADAINKKTRAIIFQYTYGIVQPVQKLASLIADKSITLIEDCCQLISSDCLYDGIATTGDAAFFSTQWNKPFSTGLGGMAVYSNEKLYVEAKNILQSFSRKQDRRRSRSLCLQLLLYNLTVRPRTRALIARLYRWAQRSGLIRGTTTAEEYGDDIPSDYLAGAINIQAILGMKELNRWNENLEHRRMLTKLYLERLPELGIDITPMKIGSDNPVLWAVPVFVENADDILSRAGIAGLPVASWFMRPPVHLIPSTAERYNYHMGQCPESEWMVTREIHLLTAPSVTLKRAEEAIKLVKQYARLTNY